MNMDDEAQLAIYEAWERHVPGVTKAEVDTLLPIVMRDRQGHQPSMLATLVAAYRAGHRGGPLRPGSHSADRNITVLSVDAEREIRGTDAEAVYRVVVHIGEHRFYSAVAFDTAGIRAACDETETQLRGWVGLAATPRGWDKIEAGSER
jgi:hypothetical protein